MIVRLSTEQCAPRTTPIFALRYQPLVVVLLAVAAGMVLDRYGQPQFLAAGIDSLGGSAWFGLWWLFVRGVPRGLVAGVAAAARNAGGLVAAWRRRRWSGRRGTI